MASISTSAKRTCIAICTSLISATAIGSGLASMMCPRVAGARWREGPPPHLRNNSVRWALKRNGTSGTASAIGFGAIRANSACRLMNNCYIVGLWDESQVRSPTILSNRSGSSKPPRKSARIPTMKPWSARSKRSLQYLIAKVAKPKRTNERQNSRSCFLPGGRRIGRNLLVACSTKFMNTLVSRK